MESSQEVLSSKNENDSVNINARYNNRVLITRKKLNIRALIGAFVFGWLMVMNYDDLGKKGCGWAFLFLAGLFSAIGAVLDSNAFICVTIIYFGAWVHTNLLLSNLQKQLRDSNYSLITETEKTDHFYDFISGILFTLFFLCGLYALYNEVILKIFN